MCQSSGVVKPSDRADTFHFQRPCSGPFQISSIIPGDLRATVHKVCLVNWSCSPSCTGLTKQPLAVIGHSRAASSYAATSRLQFESKKKIFRYIILWYYNRLYLWRVKSSKIQMSCLWHLYGSRPRELAFFYPLPLTLMDDSRFTQDAYRPQTHIGASS